MRWILLAALVAGLTGCGESQADDKVLRFSAIPDENLALQKERFQPVADYLAEALGVKVEFVPVNKYSASVAAFKTGDIKLAWFGGLTGVQARQAVKDARALAQGVEDPKYYSYFIAHKKAGLEPGPNFPAASKGMKLTFGSESSTSGRLMPEYFIRQNTGQTPDEFYAEVGFSQTHPRTLAAVNAGTYDLGALNYKTYDKAPAADKANTVLIWKTPYYADYNFTAHPDLDKVFEPGFTDRLQKVILDMPKNLCESSFSRSGMIAAQNSDFVKIVETARELGLAR